MTEKNLIPQSECHAYKLWIPPSLWRDIKEEHKKNGASLRFIMLEALSNFINKKKARS